MSDTYGLCDECTAYLKGRAPVLMPEIKKQAKLDDEFSGAVLHRYMTGVHDRHLSGLSLAVSA